MNIEIYKFINSDSNGIVTEFDNQEGKTYKISLFLNNVMANSNFTSKTSHLFKVSQSGSYHIEVELINKEDSKEKFISNNIYFNIKNNEKNKYHELLPTKKIKTANRKISNIDNYFLDLKIAKNKEDSIKKDLALDLTLTKLNLTCLGFHSPATEYEYATYHQETNFEKLLELASKIEDLDYVVYCCVCPDTTLYSPPKLPLNPDTIENVANQLDSDEVTPDFTSLQTYLNAPLGMNIREAWAKNVNGSKAVVRHLDFGVYRNHEDLKNSNMTVVNSRPETENCDHGTASTGCIIATNNEFGVTGIAHQCQYYFYDIGDLDLITQDAQAGDIVSLDVQFYIDGKLLPVTAVRSWWERIQIMVKKGATVILAAGNGGLDLSESGIMTDYGDNGSMLVGACNHNSGTRAYFSNYNQKTSLLNSWGDWSVVTTGYGSLQRLSGNERNYSKDYAGTSSATPLCSGALALIQDYAKQNQMILSAWGMREIIRKSTYTEGVNNGIGYRPNVGALLKEIDKLSQITGA